MKLLIISLTDPTQGKHKSSKDKMATNPTGTMLSEDYAEIVEEGDYSIPAGELIHSLIEIWVPSLVQFVI